MSSITFSPARLSGSAAVPPAKSEAHRALLLAALGRGECRLNGFSAPLCDDTLAMIDGVRALGGEVRLEDGALIVTPAPPPGKPVTDAPAAECHVHACAAALRMLIPAFLTRGQAVRFLMEPALFRRPLDAFEPLVRQAGGRMTRTPAGPDGLAVVEVSGFLPAGRYEVDGSRSSLFYEAVRIVKEMRCATDGRYPRYIVWENVPGAFSSNKGADFQSVLEEICSVKGYKIDPARPAKWPAAGEIVADDFSLAWRVFDAQYWGVPQRRKRIYLVADFAGGSAGKILFESEGVSGYTPQGFRPWQGAAGTFEESVGASGCVCLNDQGGSRMDVTEDVAATLRAENHGHPPCVMGAAGFCTEHSAQARGIGYEEETSPTLRAGTVPAAVYENHSQDTRYTGPLETAPTVNATYGMGGNNQPLVVEGEALSQTDSRGCLIQAGFAEVHGLSVGDRVSVKLSGQELHRKFSSVLRNGNLLSVKVIYRRLRKHRFAGLFKYLIADMLHIVADADL